jgi:acyl-CoA synthetase (AMP-forming)/AMP-acid ligase II
LLSPIAFVQKPIRWLQAISKYRATTSGAPNFAYDLLCDRVNESQLKQLDLNSWKVAFCGAEPVQALTIARFSQKFAICGFKQTAFYPCYGMAEATLMITGGDYQKVPHFKYVDRLALTKNQVMIADENKPETITLVSAGYPWLEGKLAIVNPKNNRECASNEVGEIWFSGSSIGQGYWQQSKTTRKTFQATLNNQQFLRTGDLGFIADGELYITGRLNDVLVFWGFNHYPQQIEQTVTQAHEALKANSGAAFSVTVQGKERLVIVQEIKRNYRKSFVLEDLVEAIRWEVFQQHFIDVYAIVLLTPGSLPKTSSGKVQRSACKTKFLNQSLSVMAQWSLSNTQPSDVTSLMERYTNPFTYLKMILAVTRGKLKHFFYLLSIKGRKHH